jgi:hypothetical protein
MKKSFMLLIYSLVNDSVSSCDLSESYDNDKWIGKDMEAVVT